MILCTYKRGVREVTNPNSEEMATARRGAPVPQWESGELVAYDAGTSQTETGESETGSAALRPLTQRRRCGDEKLPRFHFHINK